MLSQDLAASTPFAEIANFYDGLVNRYGYDPRACDYGRRESQQLKFRVLSEVLPMTGKRVLDVGCGFADYAGFLEKRWGAIDYVGVDLSPRMISEARLLKPDLDVRCLNIFIHPPSESFDVVNANGIFYLLGDNAAELMEEFVARMFALANSAVAFNSLSNWATAKDAGEFYADPLKVVAFCRTLTSRVVLRHDYLGHDFTIYLYREDHSG